MRNMQTVSLLELLPPSITSDPNIAAATEAVDEELRKVTACIPSVSVIPRIREIADSAIIDLLAWQFHVDFYEPDAPLEVRRTMVSKSLDWHTRKGTPSVVEEVVAAMLQGDAKVTEWFQYGGEPYFFRVITHDPLTDVRYVKRLLDAIYSVKNTRSWLEFIVTIIEPRFGMRWGAGFAILDTVTIGVRPPDAPPYVTTKKEG